MVADAVTGEVTEEVTEEVIGEVIDEVFVEVTDGLVEDVTDLDPGEPNGEVTVVVEEVIGNE